jgi:CheY-like chemotaxis protein
VKTVLVVEDTEDLRELFLTALCEAGYDAIGAEHGAEALEILESLRSQPCLVLLDLMMPVMDGRAFLNALHESHRLAALPIVAVSAVANPGSLEGVREIVKKPISLETLKRVVEEFCGLP